MQQSTTSMPVVVTMSTFQDMELLFTGTAPPPFEKNAAASRMSFMPRGAPTTGHLIAGGKVASTARLLTARLGRAPRP